MGDLDNVTHATLTADSVTLTGGDAGTGVLSWNVDEETLDLTQGGATLQLGQEVHYHVRNNTASTIPNGTPVCATGTLGASGRITVAPYVADGSIPAKFFIGVTTEDIAAGVDGKVTHFGKVRHVDTSAFSDGDILYPSPVAGTGLTNVQPVTPDIAIPCAIVIDAHSNGTIFVRVSIGHSVEEMHDVKITSLQDSQTLQWNAAAGYWENSTIVTADISDFEQNTTDIAIAMAIALG